MAVLATLLVYGLARLAFDVSLAQVAVTIAAALAAQLAATRLARLPRFDPRSALISALSLCLLLRTNHLYVAAIASAIAIGSKFLVRIRGKHVFNPTNVAIVLAIAAHAAWVSPAQWGQTAVFGFVMACAGGLVVYRAMRSDVTYAFFATYVALQVGRAAWLGDPMAIPVHRLENGGLILFAFFMISDPKTTPDRRMTRILFGALVAYVAWYIQFRTFRTNGLLWALAGLSPLVPILDRILPGAPYVWGVAASPRSQGGTHDAPAPVRPLPDLAPAR
ncbi:MAG: RnfABCDGE type electron transport complex subunit D [bacterium]